MRSEICVEKQKLSPSQLARSSFLRLFMVPHSIFHAVVVMVINQDTPAWAAANTEIENESIGGCRDKSFTCLKDTLVPKKSIGVWSCWWRRICEMDLWFRLSPWWPGRLLPHWRWHSEAIFCVWMRSFCSCKNSAPFQLGKCHRLEFPIKDVLCAGEKPPKCYDIQFPIHWKCCCLWKLEGFILLLQQFFHGKEQLQMQMFISLKQNPTKLLIWKRNFKGKLSVVFQGRLFLCLFRAKWVEHSTNSF